MLNAMENIIDDMMKNKMAKLDKRFNSTKFTNDIEEILKSMPRSDIESIAERLNFAKTYKYNKDKLIHNVISSYKERVLEKIYLFNDNIYGIAHRIILNNFLSYLFSSVDNCCIF